MAKASGNEDWSFGGGSAFGAYGPEDDFLHPLATKPGDTLTETWLYMWYVPEERISCFAYVWVHPNLGVVTGGLTAYQGHKAHHLEGELFDIQAYMSASRVGNGGDVTLTNGLRMEILEPLRRVRLTYEDAARGHALDLVLTAATPPIMRESRLHFDQVMRTEGRMRLSGRDYAIQGYGMRDRSWGEVRPEHPYPIPPYTWLTCTFPQSRLSWHTCVHDDPARNPDWLGHFDVSAAQVFKDGWIFRDGDPIRLKHCSEITVRDPRSRRPLSHRVHLVDLKDREYDICGTVVASTVWSGWPNMRCYVGLTRWEWNGETGWGDTQEQQSGDYVKAVGTR